LELEYEEDPNTESQFDCSGHICDVVVDIEPCRVFFFPNPILCPVPASDSQLTTDEDINGRPVLSNVKDVDGAEVARSNVGRHSPRILQLLVSILVVSAFILENNKSVWPK
jgi:hypothetical protein